jgi:hypothetical protein
VKAVDGFYWIDLKFIRSRLTFILNLNLTLNSNYFKMAAVRVHFSPGFPLGGGFSQSSFFSGGIRFSLREIKHAEGVWRISNPYTATSPA